MLNHEVVGLGYAAVAIISKISSIRPLAIAAQATAFLVVPIFTRIVDPLIPSKEWIKKCIHILISFGTVGCAGQYMKVSRTENFATAACLVAAQWMVSCIGNGQDKVSDPAQTKVVPKAVPVVNRTVSIIPAVCYVIKGQRFQQPVFDDFLTRLCASTGIPFVETAEDPGLGKSVIFADYRGRPGGDLASPTNPFYGKKADASVVYVVVQPEASSTEQEESFEGSPIVWLTYNPGSAAKKLSGDIDALKKALTSPKERL